MFSEKSREITRQEKGCEKYGLGSLRPAGLVDKLTREELRDLFAYLTSLGKAK